METFFAKQTSGAHPGKRGLFPRGRTSILLGLSRPACSRAPTGRDHPHADCVSRPTESSGGSRGPRGPRGLVPWCLKKHHSHITAGVKTFFVVPVCWLVFGVSHGKKLKMSGTRRCSLEHKLVQDWALSQPSPLASHCLKPPCRPMPQSS